jgi:coenzyme F420-reducing hydrogenase gamma subunit
MSPVPQLKLAWVRFTSCSGCQLMLVNCESSLADLAGIVEFDTFPLVSSAGGSSEPVDIAMVEGSLSTPNEVERLLAIRRNSRLLVAVGACAMTGGINALVKGERRKCLATIYGDQGAGWDTFPPQPVHHFVRVDWQIPGCPPERHELLDSLGSILHGGWPGHQVMPVCMECRSNENRCLLAEDHAPCLGPITAAGCNARCPGMGVPCEGCRGVVPEANRDELFHLLLETALSVQEIHHRLERFGGAPHGQVDR